MSRSTSTVQHQGNSQLFLGSAPSAGDTVAAVSGLACSGHLGFALLRAVDDSLCDVGGAIDDEFEKQLAAVASHRFADSVRKRYTLLHVAALAKAWRTPGQPS